MNHSTAPHAPHSNPDPVFQLTMSYVPSRCLSTAVQLDVFSPLANGPKTAQAVARSAKASPRGIRMLLDSLVCFQLLSKKNGKYALSPVAAQFLVRKSPDYMGALMETDALWDSWTHLKEIIRTGKPRVRVEGKKSAEEFFPKLVRSLHVTNRAPARKTAEVLSRNGGGASVAVLDVACGSGIWGISFAEANPNARVVFQDFPGLLSVTRGYVKRHKIEDRADYLPGDLKQVDFGKNQFDVALLGNIVHSEGEKSSRKLFKQLHRALKPGGKIVVIDMIPNDERTGPLFPITFALNMLANTTDGDTYTLAEYTKWLKAAGFSRVETAEIGSHSPLVIGIKG